MVTQGQGLSKRDFSKYLEGVRLVARHTNLKRCASVGHLSTERARQLREAGVQRVHHNVETAHSYYDEVTTTVRYEGRLRTIAAVREAGLETCVGGILNLGETREQRVEMAFELAAIDPTSVPINMLNPRPGTKFGDRPFMDPWEALKWIAIFRLILPDALFRLCGGRVENLGELQALAVRAGLNGVMMGNFLTTLGNSPDSDRDMFTELGLNVACQPDNAANPRPDNRSGWMEGDTPDLLRELLGEQPDAGSRVDQPADQAPVEGAAQPPELSVRLWDPSSQLRFRAKRTVPPRPDGAPNRSPAAPQTAP
jgi:biotin synthase